jgi:hypothetical protein
VESLYSLEKLDGNLTSKEDASYVEVREMDKNGNVIHVDYGIVDDFGFTLKPNIKDQDAG